MIRTRLLAPLAGVAVLVTACGGGNRAVQPTANPAESVAQVAAIVERGYVPATRVAVTESRERWFDGADALDIAVIAPSAPTRMPLVVYLPGLGETATAGELWRKPWAEAGYAVVSVQPERSGELVGRSAAARAGDFRTLAQTAFSNAELEIRIDLVRRALAEIARRGTIGTQPYASIDTSSAAFAGFHLGAQTAAALGARPDVGSRAVVLIGPIVASGAVLAAPRLVVTASGDEDPYGYVPRGNTRAIATEGARYLLALNGGSHSMLAGSGYYAPGQAREALSVPERRDGRGGQSDRPRFDGAAPFSLNAAPNDPFAADQARRPQPQRGVPRLEQIPFEPRQLASIIGVTTAFLDETMRNRAEARQWLGRDAQRWLGSTGKLGAGPAPGR